MYIIYIYIFIIPAGSSNFVNIILSIFHFFYIDIYNFFLLKNKCFFIANLIIDITFDGGNSNFIRFQ